MAGLGVRRGRLPGAMQAGTRGSAHDWVPRDEGTKPRPGMTGDVDEASLGVAEYRLPWLSTTAT